MLLDEINAELKSKFNSLFSIEANNPIHFKEDSLGNYKLRIFIEIEDVSLLSSLEFITYHDEDNYDSLYLLLNDSNINIIEGFVKEQGFEIIQIKTSVTFNKEKNKKELTISEVQLFRKSDVLIHEEELGNELKNTIGLTIESMDEKILIVAASYLNIYLKEESNLKSLNLSFSYSKDHRSNFIHCTDENIKILTEFIKSKSKSKRFDKDITISQVKNQIIENTLVIKKLRFKIKDVK